jgi:hypothetical protein
MTTRRYLTINLEGYPVRFRQECLNLLWALDRHNFIRIVGTKFANHEPVEVTIKEAQE